MDSDYSTRLLELVSRSFALCIPRLPAKVRLEVGNYYLLCRYLDSIEDSRLDRKHREKAFKRFLELLRSRDPARLEKLNADVLPFVISENDRTMIAGFRPVLEEFASFDLKSQRIAMRWIRVMASGMNEFSRREIRTFADLDKYCYYVAGTVGHYLTDIFAFKFGLERMREELKERCLDFGLLLQKVNIIRDFSRDFKEGRVFWPRELFEAKGMTVAQVFAEENSQKSQAILEEMVRDAKKHVEKSREYIRKIPSDLRGVREFCAIPLLMAIPTLEKCEKNPLVFDSSTKVKLSRVETVQIISRIGALASKQDWPK
ncbi:MAG: squalene/phytoene synthase family protein [Candidatus Diapherotrites archaeon]|uniref:Squalene/phytoene synthase family protein n=1 Tax=Candidatus Iainarchaeum sp. TaxID=3101447 RepID=A0A8T4L8Z2_9ARCH|nr:squalene/phytoene synthase family protein [Candidatus Diapherotrites archaeon]